MGIKNKIFNLINFYYPRNISYEKSIEKDVIEVQRRSAKVSSSRNSGEKNIYFKILEKIFNGYNIIDMEDTESCCYEFDILLAKDSPILIDDKKMIQELGNKRYDLKIFFSCLDNYYYYFVDETIYHPETHTWEFTTKNIFFSNEIKYKLQELENHFSALNYELLTNELVRLPVNNIDMYYKESQDVIIFDCLFTDLVTLDNEKISVEGIDDEK